MRLLRFGPKGAEKPGLLDADGRIRDLSGQVDDLTPEVISPEGLARLSSLDPSSLPSVAGSPRLGCPIAQVPNLVCIGLNYADHARETNSPIPEEPIVFMKHTGCIVGPNDQVRIPRGSTTTDWEVELGIVIGRRASYVSEADALDHVAGYTIVNDVSERHHQRHGGGGQWIKGKSPETFGPIGPWLVTRDEIPDPPGPEALARGRRPAPPGRLDQDDDLRGQAPGEPRQPAHDAAARRRHRHGHPSGRRHGDQAEAGFPQTWQRDARWD
jgi:2-keto-4-pentenoate hydratase/2-oxohepta-3-ene-1,7-dioic acid hydratase in catechol pathway